MLTLSFQQVTSLGNRIFIAVFQYGVIDGGSVMSRIKRSRWGQSCFEVFGGRPRRAFARPTTGRTTKND